MPSFSGQVYRIDFETSIMPWVGENSGNLSGSKANMNPPAPTRRSLLGFAGLATASLALPEAAIQAQETARRGRPPLKITDVRTILTQPDGEHLVVVKVLTNEPGLYGIGCATHGERPLAVAAAIDQHVKAATRSARSATASRTSGRPRTSPHTSGAGSLSTTP